MRGMWTRRVGLLASLLTPFLAACAATMPFHGEPDATPSPGKAVFLLTATLTNSYRPSPVLEPLVIRVCKKGATDPGDCIPFGIDEKARGAAAQAEDGERYFLRVALESGEYEINILAGQTFLYGAFTVPVNADVKSAGKGIVYLGNVAATMRRRTEREFSAGPMDPGLGGLGGLVVAAALGFGFYGGTFDVEITDQSERDIPEFRNRFAGLRGADIEKSILPPFDRTQAQRRWEADPFNRLREAR